MGCTALQHMQVHQSAHFTSGHARVSCKPQTALCPQLAATGKSSVLPDDKTGFWASTTQLAYGEDDGAASVYSQSKDAACQPPLARHLS